jgi:DNA topoisomerase-3
MGKILVTCRKTVRRGEIARVLNCKKIQTVLYPVIKYIVTWALGHLVYLADPEHYSDLL